MSNQTEPKKGQKQNGMIIALAAAFVIVLAALAVCVVLLVRKSNDAPDVPDRSTVSSTGGKAAVLERGFVDTKNAEQIVSEMADKVEEGMFECKMTTTWTFDNADAVSPNAYVANVEGNRNTLYFDVYLDGTDEAIYSSPLLPVGTELQNIKLEKKLSAGEYGATVVYTLVNDEYEEVSAVGFKIKIYMVH